MACMAVIVDVKKTLTYWLFNINSIHLFVFQRTYISEENKAILEELFASGMDAKGKHCSKFHDQAVIKTGLPLQVVKVQFHTW